MTDEVSLSAKAFLLGGDSDEILKYYKSKSLFLGAHSPENISIKEEKRKASALCCLRFVKIDKRDTVPFAEHIRRTCGRALLR